MGVYIKGLKMPESCKECPFKTCFIRVNIKSYTCLINGGECGKTDCPLIEIDLVRCGECKKWREDDGDMICGISELICNADDFCSHGERRTDDKTEESRP